MLVPLLLLVQAAHSQESGTAFKDLAQLLETIQHEWPVGLTRDSANNLTAVILPVRYASDGNLRLLATSPTLTNLSLSYNKSLQQPSESGIASLRNAVELRSLTIQCTGEIPKPFVKGLPTVRQLESLTLLAASPNRAETYRFLTKLPNLQRLTINMPNTFTVEDVGTLAEISQLRDLRISLRPQQLTETDCAPLTKHPGLTNLVVEGHDWTIRMPDTTKRNGVKR